MEFSAMMKIVILLCLGVDVLESAIVFGFGGCPSVVSKGDFDKSQYLGVWYEYKRFNNWFERGLKCVFADYSNNPDGSIRVNNGGIETRSGEEQDIVGKATVPDSDRPGELKVTFSSFDFTRGANYFVLDTDYTGYTLVFSCSNLPLVPVTFQTAWILTRSRRVAPANLEALENTLNSYGIPANRLKLIDQSNCSN